VAKKRATRRAPVRPSPWQVYLLRCRDGSLYAGITVDLERRLGAHQTGRGAAYTRSRRPVELVYTEPARDHSAALRREAALKRLPRAQKLELVMTASGRG
jgi:putative endonuclease